MKKISAILLVLLLLGSVLPLAAAATEAPECSAACAVVMDADTGKVIYSKNADEPRLIASITKIMTALVVLENSDIDDVATVSLTAASVEGSSMYLKAGEELTVMELVYGLLMSSGNDAAHALAEHVSGNLEDFAELMNEKVSELGLENTHFTNPHGLDDEGHYSSARDMAIITAEAMKNKTFYEIVSTKTATVAGRSLTNHNRLLWTVDGCVGVKTGYTQSAGRTLVSCVTRNSTTFICVTLNDGNDWNDHSALYNWAFENYSLRNIVTTNEECAEIDVISGTSGTVTVVPEKNFSVLLETDQEIETDIVVEDFVYAPVKKGDIVGKMIITANDESYEVPLICTSDVALDANNRLTTWEKIKRALGL